MSHYTKKEWLAYIRDELQASERDRYEDHLYHCDQCLQVYMACVEEQTDIMPKPNPQPSRNMFIPYAIAASITLILTSTGVFELLLVDTESIQSPVSYSEKAVQSLTNWLGNIKK